VGVPVVALPLIQLKAKKLFRQHRRLERGSVSDFRCAASHSRRVSSLKPSHTAAVLVESTQL